MRLAPYLAKLVYNSLLHTSYTTKKHGKLPCFWNQSKNRCFSLLQPENTFASAGYNLQVIGQHDGVNSQGLVLGLHFVSNNDYTKGLSAWTSIRMILDTCSILEDAIHMLQEIPHSPCYNFSIGDGRGNIAVVEASPEKVMARRGESLLSCVNHFQIKDLETKNRTSIIPFDSPHHL
ncbi:C45 family autoproteolytic acyltransferase/hydrolase [Microbacteriaceae bacterium 4G12]